MSSPPAPRRTQLTGQVGRFGAVGVLNTGLDYGIFIVLAQFIGLSVVPAKAISGTVAITNSFFLNRRWVFRADAERYRSQVPRFVLVTVVGVYGIQLGLIWLFSEPFPWAGEAVYRGLSGLGVDLFSESGVVRTVAFGLATLGSLTWNFVMYRRWVFRDR